MAENEKKVLHYAEWMLLGYVIVYDSVYHLNGKPWHVTRGPDHQALDSFVTEAEAIAQVRAWAAVEATEDG